MTNPLIDALEPMLAPIVRAVERVHLRLFGPGLLAHPEVLTGAGLKAVLEEDRAAALVILNRAGARRPVAKLTPLELRRVKAHQARCEAFHAELARRHELERVEQRAQRQARRRLRFDVDGLTGNELGELYERARAEMDARGMMPRQFRAGVRPKWDRLKPATDLIREMVHADPANLARADAVQAYTVEVLGDQGVDVRDPLVLYVVLSAAGMVTELAANGTKGTGALVDPATHLAIARIVQTLTAALLPYLPEEAR